MQIRRMTFCQDRRFCLGRTFVPFTFVAKCSIGRSDTNKCLQISTSRIADELARSSPACLCRSIMVPGRGWCHKGYKLQKTAEMHLHYLEKKYGIRINLLEWSGDDYETGTLNALIKMESTDVGRMLLESIAITYGNTLETS
jgi:hypothetical protein